MSVCRVLPPRWYMLKFHAAAAAACGYTRLRSPGIGTMLRLAPLSTAGAAAAAVVPWWYARNMLIGENRGQRAAAMILLRLSPDAAERRARTVELYAPGHAA